jgi:threonine/homoserine/homoserine lactone efflux protein
MDAIQLLIRGLIAGFAISAPVGPVNVLCVSRTLSRGRLAGIISGLGAATADTLYGAIAGFSISFVIQFLIRELFWIRLFGGIVLIGIGILYFFKRPKSLDEEEKQSAHSEFVTTFLLTLTNPTTVLSFLAVLAALRLAGHRAGWMTFILVGGIFAGAMLWWVVLASISNYFRGRVNDNTLRWMNRVAGIAIGGFGIVTLILAHKK